MELEEVIYPNDMDIIKDMSLGQIVNYFRTKEDLSISRFARKANLSETTISRLEKDKANYKPSPLTSYKLIEAFGWNEDDEKERFYWQKYQEFFYPKNP